LAPGTWCFAVVGALPWTVLNRGRRVDIAGLAVMLARQIVFGVLIAPDKLTFVIFTGRRARRGAGSPRGGTPCQTGRPGAKR
jgi:hypothetical protein